MLALVAWTALVVALGAVGFGVAHQLSPSILVVPGSESARAEHLANAQFGPSQLTPILLRGPQRTLDKQGPALVLALRARYQVFLLTRMREHVLAGDGPRAAARHALRHTAAAVTGTAAVMVAATIPFLFADLLSVRQFGVAVVTVVLLDALLVRPVVLPAAVELLGRRAWWPTLAPHPTPGGAGATPPARPTAPPRIDPTPV